MSTGQKRVFHYILILIGALTVACIITQTAIVSKKNSTLYSVEGNAVSEETYMDIHLRTGETSSWVKRNLNLKGEIYDAALNNNSDNRISTWTLRINISDDCYLNQFWNGESEIHQHVLSGEEKTQTLNLAEYSADSITLDYKFDDSDLLIPLEKGDYIIYHPSEAVGEIPVDEHTSAVVGMIFYYRDEISITDYTLDYYYQVNVLEGPLFVVISILGILWILVLGIYIAAVFAYRKAQKEMELRRSGIACMAELYAAILIVDLKNNSIEPVSIGKGDDARPKDLTATGQMKNFVRVEVAKEYKTAVMRFVDLSTLASRLLERSSLAVECISVHYGWCRLRFIAMDREEGKEPDKVLFTIQQINQEKRELDEMRNEIEKEQTKNAEKKDYLDSIFHEALTPVRSILELDRLILRSLDHDNENVRKYAEEILSTGESLLTLATNTLDMSALESGSMELNPVSYRLHQVIEEAESMVQISMEEKEIELKTDISGSIPDMLFGDAVKLKRVLVSMLTRIIGDIEKGSVLLQVFGKRLDEERVHLLFSVRGSGLQGNDTDGSAGMALAKGMLGLMGSELKTVEMSQDRDYYFELDQTVRKMEPEEPDHSEEAKD